MKQTRLLLTAVVSCLLFGSADLYAQRSHGGSGSGGGRSSGGSSQAHAVSSSKSSSSGSSGSSGCSSSSSYGSLPMTHSGCPLNLMSSPIYNLYGYSYSSYPFQYLTPNYGAKVSQRYATKKAFVIHDQSGDYYYREGVFFFHDTDKYVVAPPLVGFRVPNLPESRREYVIAGKTHYYYYGTFYSYNPIVKMFDVEMPPIGAFVEWIPENSTKIKVDDVTYYSAKGVFYKEIPDEGMQVWYEVVSVDDILYSER